MPDTGPSRAFQDVLREAIDDISANGYDSATRAAHWIEELRKAAERNISGDETLRAGVAATLRAAYRVHVERGGILRHHDGVARFTLERVAPHLRAELDRRIFAAVDLIKINRQQAMATTLRRFAGWITSVPPGGSDVIDRRQVKKDVGGAIRKLGFVERRVAIDQGHKLLANLSEILATDGGAIAGVWRSNWRQRNYNYRQDHKERDEQVYMLRGNWAQDRGLVKVGSAGYVEDITRPGSEIFCRCRYRWIHSLSAMPREMLTKRGMEELDKIGSMAA